ncbi:MAG: hypothetical protein ACJ740_11810 [Gaiellales bacterium]
MATAITLIALPATTAAAAEDDSAPSSGVIAEFEGSTINLAEGWGDANACSVTADGTTCYRTEAEMDAAVAATASTAARLSHEIGPLGVCSTSLRLYDGTSFDGQVVSFTTTGSLITLSSYGFDNKTSSYKVGACAATLYSGIQTSPYPGNTGAGAQATSMLSGWDNTISSVLMP